MLPKVAANNIRKSEKNPKVFRSMCRYNKLVNYTFNLNGTDFRFVVRQFIAVNPLVTATNRPTTNGHSASFSAIPFNLILIILRIKIRRIDSTSNEYATSLYSTNNRIYFVYGYSRLFSPSRREAGTSCEDFAEHCRTHQFSIPYDSKAYIHSCWRWIGYFLF